LTYIPQGLINPHKLPIEFSLGNAFNHIYIAEYIPEYLSRIPNHDYITQIVHSSMDEYFNKNKIMVTHSRPYWSRNKKSILFHIIFKQNKYYSIIYTKLFIILKLITLKFLLAAENCSHFYQIHKFCLQLTHLTTKESWFTNHGFY
jgi:hypothetical protein